jgi:hypothetical protein
MPQLKRDGQEIDRASQAVKLEVKGTGSLILDENVLHPFVRIHVVSMKTGKYLAKDPNTRGTYQNEHVQAVDSAHNI